ncbi:C-C motif chemokine 20b [Pimephales promelas]|uniref:C-C motif chemokine 20b n=1 Tax=Pimephales promelas TaxID=90988 RepID=UPI001955C448|nr:C-C motif chemokine 20b [Pimephales promelas]
MVIKIWILAFVTLLIFQVETEAGSCCLSYTKIPRRCGVLKGYDIQTITGGCDLAAIIFHTEKGRKICADPAQNWTQSRVECLKIKAARMKTGKRYAL